MVWSYSRINTFCHCPYEFYLHYIEGNKSEDNFFGQYGRYLHTILEKYSKDELPIYALSQYYEDNFDKIITCDAPYGSADIYQTYFDKGLEYFDSIDLSFEDYEILGVEKKIEFEIGSYKFIGFIDLLLKRKDSGDIIMIDHKSRSLKYKKDGNLSKTVLPILEEFKKQQYLYSKAVIEEYGITPTKLCWNMFKDRQWVSVPFNQTEYEATLKWAEWTINMIEIEEDWKPNPEFYYCRYLCGMRGQACEFKL